MPDGERLDSLFEATVSGVSRPLDSALVCAVDSADVAWAGAVGYADPASHRVVDQDANFALASITKSFVAALVLRLVESKDVVLDAPIADQLHAPVAIDLNRATVRQALANRSGIRDYWQPPLRAALAADPHRVWTVPEVLSFGGGVDFGPGERWAYSNTNFVVLGLVIEAATGQEVGATIHESFITPLGLEGFAYQPRFVAPAPHARGVALGAAPGSFHLLPDDDVMPNLATASATGAAGCMAGNARGLARWGRALYGGTLLSHPSMDAMFGFVDTGDGDRYGLATWAIEVGGHGFVGLSGETIGYTSILLYSARTDTSVAILTNAPHDAMALCSALTTALMHGRT